MIDNMNILNLKLPLFLGKKLNGEDFIKDLTELPHLLIGGMTGFGKSNLLANLIDGLTKTRTSDELKFMLIDPKMVEFSDIALQYSDYLYQPIKLNTGEAYTDISESYNAINELIREMDERYSILRRARCRSIDEYNSKKDMKMQYIVLVIDEFADLSFCSGMYKADEGEDESPDDSFEMNIARIARTGRCVGIHVILSTQRTTDDVVTGIIKANYPARLAFNCFNKKGSLIILDIPGAEQLSSPGHFIWRYDSETEFGHASLNSRYR